MSVVTVRDAADRVTQNLDGRLRQVLRISMDDSGMPNALRPDTPRSLRFETFATSVSSTEVADSG
jgi:hypothetical protein